MRLFRGSVTTRLNDPERTAIVVIIRGCTSGTSRAWSWPGGWATRRWCCRWSSSRSGAAGPSIGLEDWREREGELLFPERFPAAVVARDKAAMGSSGWRRSCSSGRRRGVGG